MVMSDELCC